MPLPNIPRETVDNLWALAVAQLTDKEQRNIGFNPGAKLEALENLRALHAFAEASKQKSIENRWTFPRPGKEKVILRDVLGKIIKWVDIFKQVGDVAVQYGPAHAALPWAGIRFVLQMAVNDYNKFGDVIESLAWMAELICRHAVLEELYLQQTSEAAGELQRALIKLYSSMLGYLSKAGRYLEQGIAKRVLKSGLVAETGFDTYWSEIRTAEQGVGQCTCLVDRRDRINDHAELKNLLARIDAPLHRMGARLTIIHDDIQASKRNEILLWMSSEPYIQHHDQAKQGVLTGTGHWLLSDPTFEKWKRESASSILWLHGIPGSGKSIMVTR